MKWVLRILAIGLLAVCWVVFYQKGQQIEQMKASVEVGRVDPEKVAKMESKILSLEGERAFTGILLTFLSAGVVGIFLVVYLLPLFAQRLTHAVYDSGEMVERDVMHDARSLFAQGNYVRAIAAFKKAAVAEPSNRLPWVEIAKIYKTHLHDPALAIQTLRDALQSQEWEINDAAYLLFRLAELYEETEGNHETAKAIMAQVVNEFPGTRHSANAAHKLHEWQLQDAAAGEEAPERRA